MSTLQKNKNPLHAHSTHAEARIIKNIKTKLKENEAMITHADKGNTLVNSSHKTIRVQNHRFSSSKQLPHHNKTPHQVFPVPNLESYDSRTLVLQETEL
jgi:hypothetical protein